MKNTFRTFIWCVFINLISFCAGLITRGICDVSVHNHNFTLLKITLIGSFVALIIAIISDYYISNNHKDGVKMKFSYFKDTYYINPKAWALPKQLNKSLCQTSDLNKLRYIIPGNYYDHFWGHDKIYYIKFSFIDWLKFRWWMVQYKWNEAGRKVRQEEEKEVQRLAEIIEAMQADVNKVYDNIKKGCYTKNKEVLPF